MADLFYQHRARTFAPEHLPAEKRHVIDGAELPPFRGKKKNKRQKNKSLSMVVYSDNVIVHIVNDHAHHYNRDLRERLLDFAVNVLKLLRNIDKKREFDIIIYQLSKSATSIGANYEEAQSSSYKEFASKTRIVLREANESRYWLKIIEKLGLVHGESVADLISEVDELTKIIGSIVSKVDKKLKA